MANFSDPVDSANEMADQVRALAYATRSFADNPGDTYWVLGSLLVANRRMQQVYSQVATAHSSHRDLAHTDTGNAPEGRTHADHAAAALRRAVFLLEKVDHELDEASQQAGRIAWHPCALHPGQRAVDVDLGATGDGIDLEVRGDASARDLNS